MPSQRDSDEQFATTELLELTPDAASAGAGRTPQRQVELIADPRESFTTAATPLLHSRLIAVTLLLLLVFGMVLVWALINEGADVVGTTHIYRDVGIVRLLFLGVIFAILAKAKTHTQTFLRGVEYSLFGVLTLLWVFARYEAILLDANAGDVAELLLDGRTSMIALFLLMVVYGMFVPRRWYETARVVLTMVLAPALVLVLFEVRHPDLARQVAELMSWRYVSTNILVVLVGAVVAIYASHVLHNLRQEIHDAKQFGQYQLSTKLGSGGMGDVYLAEHILMKRPCALKLIRSEASADPAAIARFEREVKATASLTHPHTIEIYDYGHTSDGTFYYVMEYLPGLSLADLLAECGPLPAGRVIFLLRQACSALAEAHQAGLIHRDLKPGNLYISERGGQCDFVKVLDFGLVKLTRQSNQSQLTADHVISGTPLYMAPEQALAQQDLDGRADLYALGAIAYQMLTGTPPFDEENAMAVMVAHAHQEVPPISSRRPDIPEDLQRVVMRCLEKSPDNRYATASELEQALADCSAAGEWDSQHAAVWWHELCLAPEEP